MKLADWARKQGIAYLTAYRWFKDGKLPVKAYQSDSGTIIVEDDSPEQPMANNSGNPNNDAMSIFLKKTVEFSKNNSSIEDFAAYVLSNFSLKLNSGIDSPRYSRVRPKSEDIQKHFQQFIPKGEKPKPNMFVAEPQALEEMVQADDSNLVSEIKEVTNSVLQMADQYLSESDERKADLYGELAEAFVKPAPASYFVNSVKTLADLGIEGRVSRVDVTPQNYTSSTSSAFNNVSINTADCPAGNIEGTGFIKYGDSNTSSVIDTTTNGPTGAFKPTQKELDSAVRTFKLADNSAPRKRGRKPFKNIGNK